MKNLYKYRKLQSNNKYFIKILEMLRDTKYHCAMSQKRNTITLKDNKYNQLSHKIVKEQIL